MRIQSQQQQQPQPAQQQQQQRQKEIYENYYSDFVDSDDEDTVLFEQKQQKQQQQQDEQRDDVVFVDDRDDDKQITYQQSHLQQSQRVVQPTTTTTTLSRKNNNSTGSGQDECMTGRMREQQQQQEQPQYDSNHKTEKNIQNQQHCHYTLARVIEMKARIRKRLNSNGSTNVNYNDVNIYNDGDQSPVYNLKHQYTLHELFYTGGEISLLLNEQNWGSKLTVSLPQNNHNTTTKTTKSSLLLKKSSHNDNQSLPTIQLGGLSEFAMHCISGHYQKVRTILESKTVKAGCTIDSIPKLVEKRETTLRLSPLLLVIVANTRLSSDTSTSTTGTANTNKLLKYAKSTSSNGNQKQQIEIDNDDDDDDVGASTKSCLSMKHFSIRNRKYTSSTMRQKHDGKSPGCYNFDLSPRHRDKAMNPVTTLGTHQPADTNNNNDDDDIIEMCEWSCNQLRVIKLLLEYGARPDVKDVCGKTVVHYGAGIDATVMSLKAVDMCCRAYYSAYLFNQEVIICTTTEQLIKNNIQQIQQIQQKQESTGTSTSTSSANTSVTAASKQDETTIMHLNDPNVVSTTCMTFKKHNGTTGTTSTTSTSTTNNTNSNTPSRIARMLRLNKNNNNTSNGNKQGSLQELNGKQGIAQGCIVDTGCRIVYIFGQTDEIRTLKPYQMELVSKSDTNKNNKNNNIQPSTSESSNGSSSSSSSSSNKNLCNIPDRMGRVPIVELYDTNRLDVAEFLLLQQKASIYVRTGWNTNRSTTSISTTGTVTVHDNNNKNNTSASTSNNPELSTAATSAVKRALSNLSENNGTIGNKSNNNNNTNHSLTIKEAFLNINGHANNNHKNNTSNAKKNTNTTRSNGQVDDFESTLLYNVLMSRDKSTVSQLIYALAIQQIQKEQKLLRNRCSQCNIDTTISNIPLRVCEQCLSVRFCSRECQRKHWNNGHKHHCKELAKERNTYVLVTPESLLHRYSANSNHGTSTSSPTVGVFQKPRKVEYGEQFIVKIQHLQQGGDDILWIYNKERDCEFFLYYDKNASSNYKNRQYDHRTTIDGGGGIYSIANSILQGSTHSNNTTVSTTTSNIDKSRSNTGCNDLIEKIQSVRQHQQHFTSSGQLQQQQQYKNTNQSSFWSTSSNSNNASMYITAVFENEQCCKLFIHQTKIKTW